MIAKFLQIFFSPKASQKRVNVKGRVQIVPPNAKEDKMNAQNKKCANHKRQEVFSFLNVLTKSKCWSIL